MKRQLLLCPWLLAALVSCTVGPTPVTDVTPPTVGKLNSDIVGSEFVLSVEAKDDVAIDRVEFYNFGKLLGTVKTEPYKLPTGFLFGCYFFSAKVFDTAGNATTSPSYGICVDPPA